MSVITYYCPWCRSTFSSTLIARKHAAAAMLSGHCRVDAGAFPWPISPPQSLQCRLCDDGDTYTSIDDLYVHAVAVHLPKPSPVSLPIATASQHASCTRGKPAVEDASMGEEVKKRRLTRRKSVAGGRGSVLPSRKTEAEMHGDTVIPAGSKKKKSAAFSCKNSMHLMGIIISSAAPSSTESS